MKTKELKRKEAQERQEKHNTLTLEQKIEKAGEKEMRKHGWVRQ